jgi:cytochrome c-type biogenesis protein
VGQEVANAESITSMVTVAMIAVDQPQVQAWWGPMLAFVAGVASFASPCVLPLIPGYLAFVSGGRSSAGRRGLAPILLFVLGFTIVFTLLFGFAASSVSRWLRMPAGQRVAGAFVFAFGALMVLYSVRAPLGWLYREGRPLLSRAAAGRTGALPLGMAFAVGWTPCIGPVLGSILTLAAVQGGTVRTVILLLSYSLGLGIPVVLLGLGTRWVLGASRFLSRHYHWVGGIGGAALMTIGLLLVSGLWLRLLGPVFRLVNRFTPAI